MRLHELYPFPEEYAQRKRVGRGSGSGSGCTSAGWLAVSGVTGEGTSLTSTSADWLESRRSCVPCQLAAACN